MAIKELRNVQCGIRLLVTDSEGITHEFHNIANITDHERAYLIGVLDDTVRKLKDEIDRRTRTDI